MTNVIESNRTRVYDYLLEHPDERPRDIALAMGVHTSTVTHVLSKDRRTGANLFTRRTEGYIDGYPSVFYSVTPGAERPKDKPNYRAMNAARAKRKPHQNIVLNSGKLDPTWFTPKDGNERTLDQRVTRLELKGYSTEVAYKAVRAATRFRAKATQEKREMNDGSV